jgi:ABC-2 type transport system ATP-binding protein
MSLKPVVSTRSLTKTFGQTEALRGLDLSVPKGSVCGFLGRNGAGKTTTLKVLIGLVRATSGNAEVFGLPCEGSFSSLEIRTRAAFVSERKALFPYMDVSQVIRFTRGFFPKWRHDLEQKYLKLFELPLDRNVRQLSKGMLSKLHLLLALSRGAELLLLDEPTDGLDPVVTEQVLQVLVNFVAETEGTVFFSSHRLPEIEQICDRVCLIHEGRGIFDESLDDLKDHCRRVQLVFDGDGAAPAAALAKDGPVRQDGRTVSVLVRRGVPEVVERARGMGAISIEVQPVSLKELFLETVGL